MDDETRERLHQVLAYLQESEAKTFYQESDDYRYGHVYAAAMWLIRRFRFYDLMKSDRHWRGQYTQEERREIEEAVRDLMQDDDPPE